MALKSEAILLITEKIEVVTFGSLDIIKVTKIKNEKSSKHIRCYKIYFKISKIIVGLKKKVLT